MNGRQALLVSLGTFVAYILVGNLASVSARQFTRPREFVQSELRVQLEDGTSVPVRLTITPDSQGAPGVLLLGFSSTPPRSNLETSLARRGFAVASVGVPARDPEATGASLVDLASWFKGLSEVNPDRIGVIGVQASAVLALLLKQQDSQIRSAALLFPWIDPEGSAYGTVAYRTSPPGVLVVDSQPSRFPEALSAALPPPRRELRTTYGSPEAVATDAALFDQLASWLVNPNAPLP